MPNLRLEDVSIHYEEVGEGPLAYVFCHGLGGSGQSFIEEFPFWIQHFPRVVTWDNRGLGQSSQAAKYNLPLYAMDLARLMDSLKITRAVVHGVSWGGVVTQQFALDYPDKCAALILDSTSSEVNVSSSHNWYRQGETARLDAGAKTGNIQSSDDNLPSRQVQQRAGLIKPEHLESYIANARGIAGLREHPFTPRLKHITAPVLVVGGGMDGTAGAGGSVVLARNLPNAKLHIFQDSGHGVFRQKRDEFRAMALEFCRENGII